MVSRMVATLVRWSAFGLVIVYTMVGAVYLAGRMLTSSTGWQTALFVAVWTLPLAGLAALGLLRPRAGTPTLGWVTGAVVELLLLVASVGMVPHDLATEVSAVTVFVVAVSLGFLGVHRPRFAALMMLALAVTLWVSLLVGGLIGGVKPGHLHHLLVYGPSRTVALPVAVLGLLFLLAGALRRRHEWWPEAAQALSEMSSAAERPASRRATGTRNGEQDT